MDYSELQYVEGRGVHLAFPNQGNAGRAKRELRPYAYRLRCASEATDLIDAAAQFCRAFGRLPNRL